MAVVSGLSVSPDLVDDSFSRPRSAWALSWPLALGAILFVWLANANSLLADPDSQWHITIGNWILAHGAVPTVDSFSFTFAGQPWIAKEWLSQLLLALAYDAGGWGGVAVLCAASVAFAFALMMRLLLRDIRPLPALLLTVGAAVMAMPHLLARPHVLAFPVMLIWVASLVRAVEERRAPRPMLLLVMLVWANLHGGFTLGLLLCGAFALEAVLGARDGAERKLLFVAWAKFGIGAGLVACITPYGPESMLVTFRIFNLGDALGSISEWQSPNFHNLPQQELMLLIALYVCLSRGLRLPTLRLLIVLGLVHLFLRYVRNAELLAMLAPLVIAPVLARQWPALKPGAPLPSGSLSSGSLPSRSLPSGSLLAQRLEALGRPAGRNAIALFVVVGAVYAGFLIRFGDIRPADDTMPAAALDFIREANLQGNVLNHYGFGGFLIKSGIKTFIDGRGELYGGDFIKRYVAIVNLKDQRPLEETLDEFHIDWTLLQKSQPANAVLAHLPNWKRVYGDDTATIFVRQR
jgi:hypothetical protein